MPHGQQTRIVCQRCRRPESACLCDLAKRIDNRVHIQLLQHPKESSHPKGSAILLQLSLQRITTWTGEHFPEIEQSISSGEFNDFLLYPEEPGNKTASQPENKANGEKPIRLWVLDGTWRKTYKMLQLNPSLLSLPRKSTTQSTIGQYHIRKTPKTGQLSTLEACCYTLADLENQANKYDSLLNAFEEFNQRWLKFKDDKHT